MNGIWHRIMCHANKEENDSLRTDGTTKLIKNSEKRKPANTWGYWKLTPSNKWG